jgi:hypothetical protein
MDRRDSSTEVLGALEGTSIQLIYPDAVPVRRDDIQQLCFEEKAVLGVTNDFENRLLHSVTAPFACLGHLPQSPLPGRRGRIDVVGDEELHQVTVQGI